ncbi:hypothetical protein HYDPIDRAFT_40086 [Hydnomerulius pinastri MD-312]|uniref:Uncharacterized protein n=1 Tax=Hydnomerulius pinastri MD-312 TaxID=994086 RepID=A0A0C9WFK1_9AGAM|nr:hypothetical protein HYDPIDRAFT_40086 [Hydnomerulius pinastri MD-312]
MAAFEFRSWGNIIYGVCLQGIMVVRVYAMYHRSRKVLWVLVITLTATTIWTVVENIIYIGIPSNFQVMVETLPGIIACGADLHEPIALAWVGIIRMFGFQILIFGLSSTAFVKHAIDMHRTLKRWKINHYMKVLIRENVLFFLLQVAVLSLYAPYSVGMVSVRQPVWMLLSRQRGGFEQAAYTLPVLFLWVAEPYLIGPRLVLSIREEYEQSDHIHFNTGDEIDLQVETIIHFAPVPGTPELAAEVPEQSPLLPDEAQDEIHEAELGEI